MEFQYKYKMKASDLWQLYMYYTYSSYLCIINIIFTLSSIALIFSIWATSPWWMRILLLFFLSLFTVIQPLGVYFRAKKVLKENDDEVEISFSEAGIEVRLDDKKEWKNWNQIKGIVIKPTVVVLYTDDIHGYVISNRVLGNSRKEFRSFLKSVRRVS